MPFWRVILSMGTHIFDVALSRLWYMDMTSNILPSVYWRSSFPDSLISIQEFKLIIKARHYWGFSTEMWVWVNWFDQLKTFGVNVWLKKRSQGFHLLKESDESVFGVKTCDVKWRQLVFCWKYLMAIFGRDPRADPLMNEWRSWSLGIQWITRYMAF